MPAHLRGELSPAALIDISGIDGLRGHLRGRAVSPASARWVTLRRLAMASLCSAAAPGAGAGGCVGRGVADPDRGHAGRQHLLSSGNSRHAARPARRRCTADAGVENRAGVAVSLEEFLEEPGATTLRPTELLRGHRGGAARRTRRRGIPQGGPAQRHGSGGGGLGAPAVGDAERCRQRRPHRGVRRDPVAAQSAERRSCDRGAASLSKVVSIAPKPAQSSRVLQRRNGPSPRSIGRRVLPGLLSRLAEQCVAGIPGTGG